jgi:fucose permease
LAGGVSWKWLYIIAGMLCVLLMAIALRVRYPTSATARTDTGLPRATSVIRNGFVLASSAGVFLYVAVEAAIYVWMPTLFAAYTGRATWLAAYSISIFFLLRAAGRFVGAWMLAQFDWPAVLALFSGSILACFVLSIARGLEWAVYLLPLSGLFMSVIYPTINSKGISCVPRAEHGAAAGVILFFTCVSAVLAPLMMGAVSDAMGHIRYGFWLATVFAGILFVGLVLNWLVNPARAVLAQVDVTEYRASVPTRHA